LIVTPPLPGQVCELDIIFNFEKAYFILDEFVMGGEIQDTSKKSVLKAIEQADLLQEVRGTPYRPPPIDPPWGPGTPQDLLWTPGTPADPVESWWPPKTPGGPPMGPGTTQDPL